MSSHKITDKAKREHERIQFVHENFYLAFRNGDRNLMRSLWSQNDGVSVIHPGRPPISGYKNVMESWRHILTEAPHIEAEETQISLFGDFALVTCVELINSGEYVLSAVNGIVREGSEWRLYYHHSSLIMLNDDDDDDDDNGDDNDGDDVKFH